MLRALAGWLRVLFYYPITASQTNLLVYYLFFSQGLVLFLVQIELLILYMSMLKWVNLPPYSFQLSGDRVSSLSNAHVAVGVFVSLFVFFAWCLAFTSCAGCASLLRFFPLCCCLQTGSKPKRLGSR